MSESQKSLKKDQTELNSSLQKKLKEMIPQEHKFEHVSVNGSCVRLTKVVVGENYVSSFAFSLLTDLKDIGGVSDFRKDYTFSGEKYLSSGFSFIFSDGKWDIVSKDGKRLAVREKTLKTLHTLKEFFSCLEEYIFIRDMWLRSIYVAHKCEPKNHNYYELRNVLQCALKELFKNLTKTTFKGQYFRCI